MHSMCDNHGPSWPAPSPNHQAAMSGDAQWKFARNLGTVETAMPIQMVAHEPHLRPPPVTQRIFAFPARHAHPRVGSRACPHQHTGGVSLCGACAVGHVSRAHRYAKACHPTSWQRGSHPTWVTVRSRPPRTSGRRGGVGGGGGRQHPRTVQQCLLPRASMCLSMLVVRDNTPTQQHPPSARCRRGRGGRLSVPCVASTL
jgi:hypothetical protein